MSNVDNKPYLSLSYAAGPAFDYFYMNSGTSNSARHNPIHRINSIQEPDEMIASASFPMTSDANVEAVNGGEDVTGNLFLSFLKLYFSKL